MVARIFSRQRQVLEVDIFIKMSPLCSFFDLSVVRSVVHEVGIAADAFRVEWQYAMCTNALPSAVGRRWSSYRVFL